MIVDLFAGADGWGAGLRLLEDAEPVVNIETDPDACDTAAAAGAIVIRADVAALDPASFVGTTGQISSAPCTKFSSAGAGVGRKALTVIIAAIGRMLDGDDVREEVRAAIYPIALADRHAANARRADDRRWTTERVEEAARDDAFVTTLVLEPARWIAAGSPRWVTMEQVPEVLPIWQEYARQLRSRGWSAWCGVLNAANYGVPQTRERAILIASLDRVVGPPPPTHAEHAHGDDLFGGEGLAPWVTMGQAFGFARPRILVSAQNPDRTRMRTTDEPAQTFTPGKHGAWAWFVAAGATGQGRPKHVDVGPADTITSKGTAYWLKSEHDWRAIRGRGGAGVRVTPEEAAIIQSFPPDWPWRGPTWKRFLQVGNAIPPLLAAHVLAEAIGVGFAATESAA